ncbi:MAG: chemotaxis protein CheX [Candidatus Neomarinimicrobiota bacterium]
MAARTRSAMTLRNLVRLFMQRVEGFLLEDLHFKGRVKPVGQIARVDEVILKEVVAVIKMTGALHGTIILSFDENLARKIVVRYVPDGTSKEKLESLFYDTMAEMANLIVANSIEKFPQGYDQISLGVPKAWRNQNLRLRNMGNDLWSAEAKTSHGNFSISLQV